MERKHADVTAPVAISRKRIVDQVRTLERGGKRNIKARESDLLAAAILRLLDWQSRQLQMKAERKIKAMITRQLRLRQNRKGSLSD